ncbi:MAG: HAD family hydrolase [Bacillota bacterium]
MNRGYQAVLFDLDGTLIGLDVGEFIGVYFGAIAEFAEQFEMDSNGFLRRLRGATAAMIADEDPGRTNRETFERHFFDGGDEESRRRETAIFDEFYRRVFPRLAYLCQVIPEADPMLRRLSRAGKRLVLATNPLFPRAAIDARLRWGSISFDGFEFVTSYDNSRFCKPKVQYYSEILAKLDLSPRDVLMVGNDPLEDGVAVETGMDFYLVNQYRIERKEDVPEPTYEGGVEDVEGLVLGRRLV